MTWNHKDRSIAQAVKQAALFNCRGDNLLRGASTLYSGTIVEGKYGYVVAEADVSGCLAKSVCPWQPNVTVEWNRREYPAMALLDSSEPSGFRTYVVAKATGHYGEQIFFNLEVNHLRDHQNKTRLCKILG